MIRACTACGASAPGFKCSGCHRNAYCNEVCQRTDWLQNHQWSCEGFSKTQLLPKRRLIGVNGNKNSCENKYGDDEVVRIQSSDGENVSVPWRLAKQMVTICNVAEDTAINLRDNPLPLPSVNSTVFRSIVNLLKAKEADDQNQTTILSDQTKHFSFEELLVLLKAVNYLDVPPLFPSLYAAFADHFASLNDAELVRAQSRQILTDLLKQLVFFFRTADQVRTFQERVQLDWLKEMVQSYDFLLIKNSVNWAIKYAARKGRRDVVELLLNTPGRGIDPAANDNQAIRLAALNGHRNVVELLLNTPGRGIDPAAKNNWAIREAALNGRRDMVELLLKQPIERGIKPAAEDNWAIRNAAAHGHRDMVELLLKQPIERGIDPAARDNQAIRWAAEYGRRDVVELLLNTPGRGIDPAAKDNDAIRLATANGKRDVVELLLDHFAQQDKKAFERALNAAKGAAFPKLHQWLETYQASVKSNKRQKLRWLVK